MRVVCDKNVLISGILFRGPPRDILQAASRGELRNFITPAILAEVEEVLHRRKFHLSSEQVAGIVQLLRETFETVYPTDKVESASRDPDDNRILEAGLSAKAAFIITGDEDLLVQDPWQGLRIIKPAAFMQLRSPQAD